MLGDHGLSFASLMKARGLSRLGLGANLQSMRAATSGMRTPQYAQLQQMRIMQTNAALMAPSVAAASTPTTPQVVMAPSGVLPPEGAAPPYRTDRPTNPTVPPSSAPASSGPHVPSTVDVPPPAPGELEVAQQVLMAAGDIVPTFRTPTPQTAPKKGMNLPFDWPLWVWLIIAGGVGYGIFTLTRR